jgi:hypothetical protein
LFERDRVERGQGLLEHSLHLHAEFLPRMTALTSSLCRKLRQSRLADPMVDHKPSMSAVLAGGSV